MTETTRKTAQELGVEPSDYEALLMTREILAAPELPKGLVFNMSAFVSVVRDANYHNCGTACCIGGTMMLVQSGIDLKNCDLASDPVRERISRTELDDDYVFDPLFYPNYVDRDDWNGFTREEGVQAIDAFLCGNIKTPWDFVGLREAE